jgi:integrase
MASIEKRGERYLVRWRSIGGKERGRRAPDLGTAKRLRAEIERAIALGEDWQPQEPVEEPEPLTLLEIDEDRITGGLFADFIEARRALLAPGTVRHYDRALRRFARWLAERHPKATGLSVDLLTRDALGAWFGSLVDPQREGGPLDIATARLYVTAVVSAWEWAEDSDLYGEAVKRPRRPDLPTPRSSPAVAPSWIEMDRVIAAAYRLASEATASDRREGWIWRGRLCLLLRYTGLRVDEQAMQLLWSDVDFERGELLVRGELGKSARERSGRIVPLSAHLLEQMSGWGAREGWLLAPHKRDRHSDPRSMGELWRASGVDERVWGAVQGRGKAPIHHAFRKGFKTGLSKLGVAPDVRDYLLGHHRGIDERYVELAEQARAAVDLIPPPSGDVEVNVLPFAGALS